MSWVGGAERGAPQVRDPEDRTREQRFWHEAGHRVGVRGLDQVDSTRQRPRPREGGAR